MNGCCVYPWLPPPLCVSTIYTGTCGSVREGDESAVKPGHQQRHKQDKKKKNRLTLERPAMTDSLTAHFYQLPGAF